MLASFAENALVLPRRNNALAVRAPHRFLTVSADPPLEPACKSVWLILEDGQISNQVACPDDIAWCATESTRDVTWLLSDHEVSSIHPLTLQGREDTEVGRQALQLKSQSGNDISTSSDGQRLDLRNLPGKHTRNMPFLVLCRSFLIDCLWLQCGYGHTLMCWRTLHIATPRPVLPSR
jgi:hypothetical protein